MVSIHSSSAFTDIGTSGQRVGVILVNWNGWRYSVDAYRSLVASEFQDWVLIVVDNASIDESLTHLRALGPKTHIVESSTNLGFAGGCNLALVAAEQLGVDYVFFLNNDSIVAPSTLGALMAASISLGNSAVLGSVVRYIDNGELQFFRSLPSVKWGIPEFAPPCEEEFQRQGSLIESDFIFGAALFTPAHILKSVGLFDERFFLNFEETDWCYRARAKGFRCLVVKDALTFHKGSASLGGLGGPLQTYFIQRNRLLFCEKHATAGQRLRSYVKALRDAQGLMRRAMRLHRGEPVGFTPRAKAFFLAIRDYVFRRFGDCPEIVRELARDYRDLEAAGQVPTSEQES